MIDDEIIGMCCKVLKGITVDPEHLALEVIESVGPGGNYITAPHTMDHLYSEYFRGSAVTDQKDRDTWVGDGSPDARQRACDIARMILSAEEKPYLDADTDRAIRDRYEIRL